MISIVVISKDEPALEYTLAILHRLTGVLPDVEVVVVDASEGRLDYLRDRTKVTWIDFTAPDKVRVSIPHQRNVGVKNALGDIIVFIDAGCEPQPGWLNALVDPIRSGRERMVTGIAVSRRGESSYDQSQLAQRSGYVDECATINVAFDRSVFDTVNGFDESFRYGSDVDFAWRVRDADIKIYRNIDAVVAHDWGTRRRQAKRSYAYGRARAHLYRKHPGRRRLLLRNDPIAVTYSLFICGLPLTLCYRGYPALLMVPLLRNRRNHPIRVVCDHLLYGAGVLRELFGP